MTHLDKVCHKLMDSNHELEAKCALLEKENEQLKRKNTKWILDYNGLNTEYECLKEETEWLKKFKSKVIDLIDEKIKEYKEYDGVDTESYYIGTGLLKELKEELKE